MADLTSITLPDNTTYNFKDGRISLPLPIASGGTGATTAADAISNLGAVDLTSDQVIDGYKEFSEGVTVRSYVEFKSNASTDNGSIWISDGGLGPQFTMYIYRTGAQDTYYLPRLANTESGNHSYLILSEKAPVTIAQGGTGATTAAAAITNLGAVDVANTQTITGTKSFTSAINTVIQNAKTILYVKNPNDDLLGFQYVYAGLANDVLHANQWDFGLYSHNSTTGERLSKYEEYKLPAIPADLASSGSYDIWTSKDNTQSLGTSSNYVKLQNGMMIQWGTMDLTSMSLSQIGSSGIYSSTKMITFPTGFYDTNYVMSGRTRYSTGHSVPIGFNVSSTTQAQVVVYDFYARSGTIVLKWQAVGRWK